MELTTNNSADQSLLDAQLELWHSTFAFMKSMALKSAVDLRIADAIHLHGGAATLPQILTKVQGPSPPIQGFQPSSPDARANNHQCLQHPAAAPAGW